MTCNRQVLDLSHVYESTSKVFPCFFVYNLTFTGGLVLIMFYRIKQFLMGITAKTTIEDINFVKSYLNDKERELFFKLQIHEQVHSIKVARDVINISVKNNLYDIIIIKAALLHDIGKINSSLNIINKSIIILMDKFIPKITKKLMIIKPIYAYYNHPYIGSKYLYFENEDIQYLVKNHHNYYLNDEKLKILQEADCRN